MWQAAPVKVPQLTWPLRSTEYLFLAPHLTTSDIFSYYYEIRESLNLLLALPRPVSGSIETTTKPILMVHMLLTNSLHQGGPPSDPSPPFFPAWLKWKLADEVHKKKKKE